MATQTTHNNNTDTQMDYFKHYNKDRQKNKRNVVIVVLLILVTALMIYMFKVFPVSFFTFLNLFLACAFLFLIHIKCTFIFSSISTFILNSISHKFCTQNCISHYSCSNIQWYNGSFGGFEIVLEYAQRKFLND